MFHRVFVPLLSLLLRRVSALDVRFDPPNGTIISSGSSISIESVGATHLCFTTSSSIDPQCFSDANATSGCSFGSTKILAESTTITTSFDSNARITAVGCDGNITSELLSAVYTISASAGVVTYSPLPSLGNVRIGDIVQIQSNKATYMCVTQDGTSPTCSSGSEQICGNGESYLGDRVNDLEITNSQGIIDARGCTDNAEGNSEIVRAKYTLGPVAQAPAFVVIGNQVNETNAEGVLVVRTGAQVSANSNFATTVCYFVSDLKEDDDNDSEDSSEENVVAPTCNNEDGSCGAGSTSNPVVIVKLTTVIVSAIGCTLDAEAGTDSIVTQSRYTIGKIVKKVTVNPIGKGKVQTGTTLQLNSVNADAICWSSDTSFSVDDTLCLEDGTGCVLGAHDTTNVLPNVTILTSPMTVTVEGCTNLLQMGINSKTTVGPLEIGASASMPQLSSTSVLKAGDVVSMDSADSTAICWSHWIGPINSEMSEAEKLEIQTPKAPICSDDGTTCLLGVLGDRTESKLTEGANVLRTLVVSAVGCADTRKGPGGGTHSKIQTFEYTIVPELATPTFIPPSGTQFKSSIGTVSVTGGSGSGGACYVLAKASEVGNDPENNGECPVQGPECISDPTTTMNEEEKLCLTGEHMDLIKMKSFVVSEDVIICMQSCSTSSLTGLHSKISVSRYVMLKGDKQQLAVLENMYENMGGKLGQWSYDWNLESFCK